MKIIRHNIAASVLACCVLALPGQEIEEQVIAHGPATGHRFIAHAPGPSHPATFLGLEVTPVEEALGAQLKLPEGHGLVVRLVVPDSPAVAAGLQKNDVLVKLDDQLLIDSRQLSVLVRSRAEGDTIALSYIRAGKEARTSARLTKRDLPPAPGPGFGWIGTPPNGQHDVLFRREFSTAHTFPHATEFNIPIPPPGDGPRVMVFRPRTRIVYADETARLEVWFDTEGRHLLAKDPDGKTLFSGPISTPEQRAAIPKDLQPLLEKLEALDVEDLDHAQPMPAPTGPLSSHGLPEIESEDVLRETIWSDLKSEDRTTLLPESGEPASSAI